MKFNFIFLLLFLSNFFLYSQSATYFIKYKDYVDKNIIQKKLDTQVITETLHLKKSAPSGLTAEPFAKGLAKNLDPLSKIIKVTFRNSSEAENYLADLKSNDNSVEYIQPMINYKIDFTPNDSLLSEQWALEKIGAFDAWNITQGSDSVIIGVIDTGIDYLHPDLKNKIYTNFNETGIDANGNDKRTNNIDDDGNGFIDDWQGWDFTDRVGFPFDTEGDYLTWDNDPMDGHSHGTFVAGILGAESNNISGVSGVAPNCKILNLRAFDPTGNGEEDDVAAAILYAVQMGVKVLNMSFGDYSFSYVLRDVIRYAYSQNVVLVASSGNTNTTDLHYPSGYPEVISVGNSTEEDFLTGSYGSTLDLVAPGTNILSAAPNSGYSTSSGTSASAPHVSASAALILSIGNYSNEEVKQILKSTSDDINTRGWDIRSGAGRLNLFKALSVLAPAKVKINYPYQDFSTFNDTLNFNVSVISPYFVSYNFLIGEGLNPEVWTPIITDGKNQVINDNIFNLDISSFSDGAYTARLVLYQSNGNTSEERINFFIERSPPQIVPVRIAQVNYGNSLTISAEVYTNQRATVRLYYRIKGTNEFNFITLDGFNINSQFIKEEHYGFIPKQLVTQNAVYEIYLEAINLAGLKNVLLNNGNYFELSTESFFANSSLTELSFNLPKGEIFKNPVNFLSEDFNEVLFNQFYTSDTLSQNVFYSLYRFSNNQLIKIDSIKDKFPADMGDFNNNGKKDLLSFWGRTGFIQEQAQQFSLMFENKYQADSNFYPVLANDIDNDSRIEIIVNIDDQKLRVYELNDNLTPSSFTELLNTSSVNAESNFPNNIYRNGVITADLNGDGTKEIWFVDYDGDLISYKVLGENNFVRGDSLIENQFLTNQNKIIDAGDFDGDGVEDIALLYETNSIAPLFLLRILNFKNNILNILYEKFFIDQSAEFTGFGAGTDIFQTLRFTDINSDGKDELVINIFPYLYIIQYDETNPEILYYSEGINSASIFSGDINKNGMSEIGFLTPDGFKFFEFLNTNSASTPYNLSGFSLDSSSVFLSWNGNAQKYYIFKGDSENTILLYDSTETNSYTDTDVLNNKNYYYRIQSFDNSYETQLSSLTPVLEVYSHIPARVVLAESKSNSSVIVAFSEKMNNYIENLASFEIAGKGIPNSISPLNQFSYLLSFEESLAPGENKLIIKKLRDFFGSPVKEDTISFIVNAEPIDEQFFISSFEIINSSLIKIIFNLEVDENSAVDISNYEFQPDNKIITVSLDKQDKKIIYIQLDGKKPVGAIGREFRLKVNNLYSSGNIKINSEAGSYIVLTSFAKDLSDIFVYPSPAKIGEGDEKITFANLPKKARIYIFSLNGERIFNLEENDGNGGVDFNLRTESGDQLSSGIYIYKIIRLDESDNEVEEKIGKFAVIN